MNTKKKLIISGQNIHDVGYRPFLLGIAESIEIERFFADNIILNGKQTVYVLIDSSEEKVDSFIEIASSKYPEISDVEKVEVEDYKGNVMKIESFYRYLTAMQLAKIAMYGGKMLDMQKQTVDMQTQTLDNQKLHMEITRNGFAELKDEMRKGFHDVKCELREIKTEIKDVKKEIQEVKTEIHMQRDDFKEMFMREVNELHIEINEIKATLSRMQAGRMVC